MWVDMPKSAGKAVLWHPRGMEHGNPGNDAPGAPLPPGECFAGTVQGGARNGSTWGLHAPVTPFLVLLHPLLTFMSPQQQGEKGRQHRCCQEGGEQRCWCLLNIASRTGSGCPRGSITQLFTLARLLPVLPGGGERGGRRDTIRTGTRLAGFRRVPGTGRGSAYSV